MTLALFIGVVPIGLINSDTKTKIIQVESITDRNLDSLAALYMAVCAIFFVYHFTVARRVARLQDEITRISNA